MYVALKMGYVTSPVLLPINQGVTQQLTQSVTTMAHVCMYIIHESYFWPNLFKSIFSYPLLINYDISDQQDKKSSESTQPNYLP